VRNVFGRLTGGVVLLAGAIGAGAGVALVPQALEPAGATTTLTVNDAGDAAPVPANCSLLF
jgi:hypothetical protein